MPADMPIGFFKMWPNTYRFFNYLTFASTCPEKGSSRSPRDLPLDPDRLFHVDADRIDRGSSVTYYRLHERPLHQDISTSEMEQRAIDGLLDI